MFNCGRRMNPYSDFNNDIRYCRTVMKTHGKSYFYASFFFPRKVRQAIWVLYAVQRISDDIVDEQPGLTLQERLAELEAWRNEWRDSLVGEVSSMHPVIRAYRYIQDMHAIPPDLLEAFFDAMISDTHTDSYATWAELCKYIYGSATANGIMVLRVIGGSEAAFPHAHFLAEAMQLTNFIRDIDDDFFVRHRLYLPLEDLARFGVTQEMIRARNMTPEIKELVRYEIQRARSLYAGAGQHLCRIHYRGRLPVFIASELYSSILDVIERRDFNIFSGRAYVSPVQKIGIIIRSLWYYHIQYGFRSKAE